ncbi:hypothetical protein CLV80_1113 [Yoonia maritima]|uniref:Inner membrane protein n=1 Tax=Yoonia maritima TaxID=1435347 RepID=A0A2T0VVB7_9RHOB|nr:hypothetical protein [Yoonia maritima]PRY75652.1 hypothetical protein CLV80_1113 [Yoonia maritima]
MATQPATGRKVPSNSAEAVNPLIDSIPAEVYPSDVPLAPDVQTPEAEAASQVVPDPIVDEPAPAMAKESSSSGFLPLLLGGVIAGGIGFAVASLTMPTADTALSNQVATQASAIQSLNRQVAAMGDVNAVGIENAQDDLSSHIVMLETELRATLADLEERTAILENTPSGSGGGLSTTAYQAELDALRAQLADMTEVAETRLDTARAEAAAIEENAAAAARNAAARAALARVQTALESGAPIGAALGDLEDAIGEPTPEALIAVQDGVPTMQNLREGYADVARAALATARNEGVSGEDVSGFSAFLRDQFDLRSTAPREGNDADAILSRAESALNSGRLSDALAEISGLPEVARAEMSEWLTLAESRADALAAVDMLSTSLSDN